MRNLNLDHLRALAEVVRQGSFSAAARTLNLTQPAVSRRARGLTRDPWSSNVPAGTLGIGR